MIKVERVMFSGDLDVGVINPLDLRSAAGQMCQDFWDGIIKKCIFVDLEEYEDESVEYGDLFDEEGKGVVSGAVLSVGALWGGCE